MSRALAGRVILITGASSGIGAATAELCAQAGMDVTLTARRADRLREVASRVEAFGRRACVVPCDVDDREQLDGAFEASWEAHGRLDVIFANAGYGWCGSVLDTSDEAHRAIFETNYFGTLHTIKAGAADLDRTSEGLKHVLICTSAASEVPLPMFGAYAATKAAQDSIAGALRGEMASSGWSVMSVHPVGTTSEFFEQISRKAGVRFEEETPNTPPFLAQTPRQVARAIVKGIRRPCPEIWPKPFVRYGTALMTAFPRLAAYVMSRRASLRGRKEAGGGA